MIKKLSYLIILLVTLFISSEVYANDIKKITMDIYVNNNGDALVTEEWTADLDRGTEGYKPYYNLGNSEIKNFKVYLNNYEYETLSSWNVNASFNEKAYKAGINKINNGYELCFGISKYGLNTYRMVYTITNFVSSVNDADMIYWQLVPYDLSDKPDYVYIKIHSDFAYANDLPVWGYGNYGGYAYVYDGYIEMLKEDGLDSDEYMTILVKFPKGTFNTSSKLNKDFTYYLDMANDGAKTYSNKPNWKNIFIGIIIAIFGLIINFLPYIIILFVIYKIFSQSKYGTKKLKFGKIGKKVKNSPYFRDIPLNKDIFKAYWVACEYNLIKKQTDFLGAILLKWLKNNNIENVTIEGKSDKALKLISSDNLSVREKELFDMMLKASVDGVLESNEFTKWCKNNYNKILSWFNNVIDDQTINFVNEGLIREEKGKFTATYYVDDKMMEYAIQMDGLKNFLNDFSNIKDREAIEVKIWEYYLMYAQIFGIAEKVAKEFKRLYPDILTDDYYNDVIFIHTISAKGVSAASTAKSRAESYSSGGGGFSSGGGGGGSFGGGGGGGGFR